MQSQEKHRLQQIKLKDETEELQNRCREHLHRYMNQYYANTNLIKESLL